MTLSQVLQKKYIILQQYKNWYVLDDRFSWNIETLYNRIFRHLDSRFTIPVIFCSIREANKIISDLGDEEEEYLHFASGIYSRELGIIFIFVFDEYIPLIKTLFHEFRHVMQDRNPHFRHHFDSDRSLPYKERITEIDAFQFAEEKTKEYLHLQLFIGVLQSVPLFFNIWMLPGNRIFPGDFRAEDTFSRDGLHSRYFNLYKHLGTIWRNLWDPLLPNF